MVHVQNIRPTVVGSRQILVFSILGNGVEGQIQLVLATVAQV
jgi:hypothetical protein